MGTVATITGELTSVMVPSYLVIPTIYEMKLDYPLFFYYTLFLSILF